MTDTLKTELPPHADGLKPGSREAGSGRAIGGWANQKPGRSTPEFLAAFHGAILFSVAETGSFNMKQLDHRSEHYLGVSNKEVTIHASSIIGRPISDYGLAKLIVLRTLMENAHIQRDFTIDPDLLDDLNALQPGTDDGFAEAPPPATTDPVEKGKRKETSND